MEICEDLDTEKRGYISVPVLAKILKGIPGARPELTQMHATKDWPGVEQWLDANGGSSIKGKVNYRVFLRNVNLFNHAKPHDHLEKERFHRIRLVNQTFEGKIQPKTQSQMRKELMQSHPEVYQFHPNDSPLEHFYQKNQLEYPEYQYNNGRGFGVSPEDERQVFGHKYLRLPPAQSQESFFRTLKAGGSSSPMKQ